MSVLRLCVGLALIGSIYGAFRWRDCSERAAAVIDSLTLTPSPVTIPGPITINVVGRITRAVDNLDIRITLEKSLGFLGWFPSPCTEGWGTCTHDLCGVLVLSPSSTEYPFGRQILQGLTQFGLTPTCPIPQQEISVANLTVDFPRLPGLLQTLASGAARMTLRFVDRTSNAEELCVRLFMDLNALP